MLSHLQDVFRKANPRWIYALLLASWLFFCYIKALKGGDFDVYLDAANKLMEGKNIYAPPFAKGLQYYYSVAFALVLSLFLSIPVIGKFLWLVFSTWCIYRSWCIMQFFVEAKGQFTKQHYLIWKIIIIVISARFILYNFLAVQLTLFLLWVTLEAVYQSYKGRQFYGGLILGIAINIKLLPLVILPYLLFRSYYIAFFSTIFMVLLLLFAPALWIGTQENYFLLTEWGHIINPISPDNSLKGNKLMHSLAAVIPAYFMEPIDGFSGKRQIFDFSPETIKMLIQIIRACLILLTLYFLRWWPFCKAQSKSYIWWELSYILLIVPLIFPHQQKYSFWFMMPCICYLTFQFLRKDNSFSYYAKVIFILLLLLISPVIGRDVLGDHLYDLFQFYKILSLVAFCFIFFLIKNPPLKANEEE